MAAKGYRWKRSEKTTGLASVAFNNHKRSWQLHFDGKHVGNIQNSTAYASHAATDKDEWSVNLYQPTRLTLTKRFQTEELKVAKEKLKRLHAKAVQDAATTVRFRTE